MVKLLNPYRVQIKDIICGKSRRANKLDTRCQAQDQIANQVWGLVGARVRRPIWLQLTNRF